MAVDLALLALLLRWLAGWSLLWRVPGLREADGPAPAAGAPGPTAPTVSVVIPARNEAHNLPKLLAALAAQTRPADEIVVVDDHSTDGTAAIARAAGARVITAPPLPAAWTGKSWACWRGAHAATGEVLVFLDADTEPAPDLLVRLVAEQRARGGLVSVQPYHRMERAYERASAYFNVVAFMGVGAASFWPRAKVTGAFGPCIACRRDDYVSCGGHEAVKSAVLEDVELGRRFLDAGHPVAALAGRDLIVFRMYPEGPARLVEGWSKNFAAGAGTTPLLRLLLAVAWLSAAVTAAWELAVAPGLGSLAWYALFVAQLGLMLRPIGRFGLTAAVFPLPLLVFLLIFFRSVWLTARGEVEWKGRTIPVRASRRRVAP